MMHRTLPDTALLDEAQRLVQPALAAAADLLRARWGQVHQIQAKGPQNLVSEVDFATEALLLEVLQKNFPEHAVLSEERGWMAEGLSEYHWVIDPLDGTINYVQGLGPYCLGLALLQGGCPILNALVDPLRDRYYWARIDQPAVVDGQPLRVSSKTGLAEALVLTHLSSQVVARQRTLQLVEAIFAQILHLRMQGSGLMALAHVAGGQADIFFNVHTQPWDILPGALLVEQAGGVVTDLAGQALSLESRSVLAANPVLHQQMLAFLAQEKAEG